MHSRRHQIELTLTAVKQWAHGRDDVRAVALVGSHARDAARPGSDLDLVVLTSSPSIYIDSDDWTFQLGALRVIRTMQWGVLTERRLLLSDGLEVDVGVARPSWASTEPLDTGTARIVADGLVPVYDPDGMLATLLSAAETH